MDLIGKAKKSNKEAYLALIDKYNIIFYKVARVYFSLDVEISNLLEKSLINSYKTIANCKDEREYLISTIKEIIRVCLEKKSKAKNSSNENIAEILQKNTKYMMYKSDSIVEKCMLKLEEKDRIVVLLYFYVDFSPKEISSITNISKSQVNNIINSNRTTIYNYLRNEEE